MCNLMGLYKRKWIPPEEKTIPPNRMDTPPKTILYTIYNYDTNIPPYHTQPDMNGRIPYIPYSF